jgi:hypothetical protein
MSGLQLSARVAVFRDEATLLISFIVLPIWESENVIRLLLFSLIFSIWAIRSENISDMPFMMDPILDTILPSFRTDPTVEAVGPQTARLGIDGSAGHQTGKEIHGVFAEPDR